MEIKNLLMGNEGGSEWDPANCRVGCLQKCVTEGSFQPFRHTTLFDGALAFRLANPFCDDVMRRILALLLELKVLERILLAQTLPNPWFVTFSRSDFGGCDRGDLRLQAPYHGDMTVSHFINVAGFRITVDALFWHDDALHSIDCPCPVAYWERRRVKIASTWGL